jgi:hypothetical protein
VDREPAISHAAPVRREGELAAEPLPRQIVQPHHHRVAGAGRQLHRQDGSQIPVERVIEHGGTARRRRRALGQGNDLEAVAVIEIERHDGADRVEARRGQHDQTGTDSRLVGDADPDGVLRRRRSRKQEPERRRTAGMEKPAHHGVRLGVKRKLIGR